MTVTDSDRSSVEKIRAWSVATCAVIAAIGSVVSIVIAKDSAGKIMVIEQQGNSREARILRLSKIAHDRAAKLSGDPADIKLAEEARQTYDDHMAGQRRVDDLRNK